MLIPDQPPRPDAPTSPFTNELAVGGLINSPLKGLVLGILVQDGSALTSTGLIKRMNDIQPEESAAQFPPSSTSTMDRYTEGLYDAGLAVSFYHGSRKVTQITDRGVRVGLPMAGLIAGWQLQHADIPLQNVFGVQTRGAKNSLRNSAHLRFNVLEGVIANPTTTLDTIATTLDERYARVTQAARALVADNILVSTTGVARGKSVTVNPENLAAYTKFGRASTPEKLAVEATARELLQEDILTVSREAFLDRLTAGHSNLDRDIVWADILKATAQGRLGYLELSQDETGLRITPERAVAISGLVSQVRRLTRGDEEILDKGRRQAESIFTDPSSVDILVAIGRNLPHQSR